MSNQTNTINSIAVVGAGGTGWTVAAALAQGLRGLGIDIFLVDDPDYREIDPYCEVCLPAALSFLHMLSIDEQEFVAVTRANYLLANHYQSWAFETQDYFMPFNEHGFMLNRIEFPQYAIFQHLQGNRIPYDTYSLSAVAARKRKFRPTSPQPNSLFSTLSYGLQLNSDEYTGYLAAIACRNGVKHLQGKIIQTSIDPQTGGIESLQLDRTFSEVNENKNGKLNADFYVDCTGLQSLLIEQALKIPFISAEDELPANAVASIVKPCHKVNHVSRSLKPATHGWLTSTYTQKQEQLEYYFQTGSASCNRIIEDLNNFGDVEKTLQFRPLKPGRRKSFWYKNCVAIGESGRNSGNFLVSKSHLVQSAVLRILSLFPSGKEAIFQQQEYNRLTHLELDHIVDLHQLHYRLCKIRDSEFWSSIKTQAISERLDHKLRVFKHRGIIPFYEGETFSPGLWTSLLLGADYWPDRHDPIVLNTESSWIYQQLNKLYKMIDEASDTMPEIGQYLSRFASAQKIQA